MEADDLLCSRNARPQKALVGRAQGKINQPPSLRENEWEKCGHLWKKVSSGIRGVGRSAAASLND